MYNDYFKCVMTRKKRGYIFDSIKMHYFYPNVVDNGIKLEYLKHAFNDW